MTFWEKTTMQIPNLSSGQRVTRPSCQRRSIYVAAVVGMAIAVLLIAPVVLMGASSAHADTGVNGYARCLGGDAKPPPPGVSAEDWFPSVHVIATDLDSAVPPAQVAQRLVEMGVNPNDAVTRVQCFLANQPRGEGH
jgi:hypothetical protein|nr:hypothetical protein [Mycobacterium sp.]